MNRPQLKRSERHTVTRSAILDAARRVAARDGAREFSLRAVAAEADFAPAALYSYFKGKDELLLALAADDLSDLARTMRGNTGNFSMAAAAALDHLQKAETIVAASGALPHQAGQSEAERLFNGRLITVLKALAETRGMPLDSREAQVDIVVLAASLTGLAVLARSGRIAALGFSPDEIVAALDRRFAR
jgi:AcrR family transcriptional regulator